MPIYIASWVKSLEKSFKKRHVSCIERVSKLGIYVYLEVENMRSVILKVKKTRLVI